jgi:hypothetical protein
MEWGSLQKKGYVAITERSNCNRTIKIKKTGVQ